VSPHAHNGYLDILLQGGLIALTLFALLQLMVSLWIDRVIDVDPGLGYFLTSTFLYMLLQNLLETDWLQSLSGSSMLVTLMILLASVAENGRRRA
jgi:O-antigen ligase